MAPPPCHGPTLELAGHLASGLAHDFNNLLQVVGACLDLAAAEADDPALVRELIQQAHGALSRASDLAHRLQTFGSPGTDTRQSLDLNDILSAVAQLLAPLAGARIRIETHWHHEPLRVVANGGQIEQVLMNLCLNAKDAMPGGGLLTLSATVVPRWRVPAQGRRATLASRYAVIEVGDTGTGIAPDLQERIFEPFFTTKPAGHGNGLGLAMVNRIARAHEGFVAFESTAGEGSTFRVYLPFCDR